MGTRDIEAIVGEPAPHDDVTIVPFAATRYGDRAERPSVLSSYRTVLLR
jgi:hypothetical protein